MGDLSIQNLVVEYYSGGYALRPINGLEPRRGSWPLVEAARTQRLRQDDTLSPVWAAILRRSLGRPFDEVDITTPRRRVGELP